MAGQQNTPKYPKLAYTRDMPDTMKALLTKLVSDPTQTAARPSDARNLTVSRDLFEKLSTSTGQDVVDADAVFQLLPDVELAEQILVGSILSPKDMSSVDLNFTINEAEFDSELARPLLSVVEDHFKKDYRIDDRLDGMLEEVLFTKGAHILAVLPENHLDAIINASSRVSVESFGQAISRIKGGLPLGFLGHPRESRVSMESFRDRDHSASKVTGEVTQGRNTHPVQLPRVTVSDNYNLLKAPNLSARRRSSMIGKLLTRNQVSMESASKGMSPEDIDQLYQRDQARAHPTHVLTQSEFMDRPSMGRPLVMKLPIESVIPVHVPGQPEEHIGYFVMIDEHGRPIVKDSGTDHYGQLRSNFKANTQDNSSDLIRRTREAMGGATIDQSMEFDQIQNSYAAIIENDLINRLRNGIYKEDFTLGATDDLYRIMLYRSMKQQNTQLLYLPVELVEYIAFDYNRHGIGQSLLTQSKILSSMRSVLLFAETMAGVRNAIGRKRANISVDADDPDPEKTISDVQAMILESSHRGFPLGSPDPGQTLDYLNRAGFDFSINVESENYPTTKVEFDDYNSSIQPGNPEMQDRLRRMQISSWGLNPELVDPTTSPDFATSVVNNNLIMTRRVIRYQKKFTRFLSRFTRTYTHHSGELRGRIAELLEEHKAKLTSDQKKMEQEDLIDLFIQAIQVALPQPDTTQIDQQLAAFDQYTSLLERTLEAYITPDLFSPEILAREADMVEHVSAIIKAYYQRTWLARNNIMPELDKLTEMTDDTRAFNLLDVQTNQFDTLGEAIQEYLDGIEAKRKAWVEKNQPDEGTGDAGDTGDEWGSTNEETGTDDVTDDWETDGDTTGEAGEEAESDGTEEAELDEDADTTDESEEDETEESGTEDPDDTDQK